MMPPIRSPVVKTEFHQPSPDARAPRVAHSRANCCNRPLGLLRIAPSGSMRYVVDARIGSDPDSRYVHDRSIYKRQIAVPVVCDTHTWPATGRTTIGPGPAGIVFTTLMVAGSITTMSFESMHGTHRSPDTTAEPSGFRAP